MKKFCAPVFGLALLFCVGCGGVNGGGDPPAEELTEIFLSETEIEIEEGEVYRLTVRFAPQPRRMPEVIWTVSDGEIAEVEKGIVTGKKPGETIVTARTGENTAACPVSDGAFSLVLYPQKKGQG